MLVPEINDPLFRSFSSLIRSKLSIFPIDNNSKNDTDFTIFYPSMDNKLLHGKNRIKIGGHHARSRNKWSLSDALQALL